MKLVCVKLNIQLMFSLASKRKIVPMCKRAASGEYLFVCLRMSRSDSVGKRFVCDFGVQTAK